MLEALFGWKLAIPKQRARESQEPSYKIAWVQEGIPTVKCKFLPKQEPSVLY